MLFAKLKKQNFTIAIAELFWVKWHNQTYLKQENTMNRNNIIW